MMKDIPLKPAVLTLRLPYYAIKCHWSKRKACPGCCNNSAFKWELRNALPTGTSCGGRRKARGPAAGSTGEGKKEFNLDEQSGCHL